MWWKELTDACKQDMFVLITDLPMISSSVEKYLMLRNIFYSSNLYKISPYMA